MKKIIKNEQNKLRKEIYMVISACLFVGAIFSEKYLSADEMVTKPESEIGSKLEKLIDEGKITEDEAEIKIEAILSGEDRKKRGMFEEKPTESEIKSKLEKLIDEGKITEDEAEIKLEAILSGEKIGKKRGMFGKNQRIEVRSSLKN